MGSLAQLASQCSQFQSKKKHRPKRKSRRLPSLRSKGGSRSTLSRDGTERPNSFSSKRSTTTKLTFGLWYNSYYYSLISFFYFAGVHFRRGFWHVERQLSWYSQTESFVSRLFLLSFVSAGGLTKAKEDF